MKFHFLFLAFITGLFVFGQQNSIMQPAIKNSDQKLDSVVVFAYDIFLNKTLDQRTEKWVAKKYDGDKNPIEFMVYYYEPYSPNGTPPIDSLKVALNHYPYQDFNYDFRSHIETPYEGEYYYSNGIYNVFNLKSLTTYICNPNTEEWLPLKYLSGLPNTYLPNFFPLNETTYFYDENYELQNIQKSEGTTDGQSYFLEHTYYAWDEVNGFTPLHIYNYDNSYNANGELIEVIRTYIDDPVSGIEINNKKYEFIYDEQLFEYIAYNWNQSSEVWEPLSKVSYSFDTENHPILRHSYHWYNNEWVLDEDFDYYRAFTNGLYSGYSYHYPYPTSYDVNHELLYNNDNLVTNENHSEIDENLQGEAELKEFYYSDDNGIGIDENNINTVLVYPNPAKNYINIQADNTPVNYRLYTTSGKIVLSGIATKSIELKGIHSGIYYLKVFNTNETITKKLVVK